mmetsp:Transcript_18508/g.30819  ORF Transcript_18508/g.30819 Transcript_18508/m.30819 type:complete len:220 (+) Transcript_18508:47-706(+)
MKDEDDQRGIKLRSMASWKAVSESVIAFGQETVGDQDEEEVEEDSHKDQGHDDHREREEERDEEGQNIKGDHHKGHRQKNATKGLSVRGESVKGSEVSQLREDGNELRAVVDGDRALFEAREGDLSIDVHASGFLGHFLGLVETKVHVVQLIDLMSHHGSFNGAQVVFDHPSSSHNAPVDLEDVALSDDQRLAEGQDEADDQTRDGTGKNEDEREEEEL